MSNKGFASLALIGILIAGLGIAAFLLFPQFKIKLQQGEKPQTTFLVEVPTNTPDYSAISIQWYSLADSYWEPLAHCSLMVGKNCALEKISKNKWKGVFLLQPGKYAYRYSRGMWEYAGAEEFVPESPNKYRVIEVKEGGKKTFDDKVGKWRWLPELEASLLAVPSSVAQTISIQERVRKEEFQRGIAIQDFWDPWMNILIEPTHKAMKANNVNWVALSPPWGYTQIEPLPVISESSFYSMDNLRVHLEKLKKDGFKVHIAVQYVCPICEEQGMGFHPFDKRHSNEWWNAWYKEIEKTSFYFADLAKKYDVEMLSLFGGLDFAWQSAFKAPDAEKKFSQLLDRIRQRYSGKIGIGMILGGKPPEWQDLWPPPSDIPAFDKYDFIALGLMAALVENNNPTQEQINVGSQKLFKEKIEPLYAQYKKPIILTPGYASYKGVLQNPEKYTEEESMIWAAYNPKVIFDAKEQAMAYEAIMNAVSQIDYVIGVYPFGYLVEDFPLSTTEDIRGKPAEQIITGWYKRFAEK